MTFVNRINGFDCIVYFNMKNVGLVAISIINVLQTSRISNIIYIVDPLNSSLVFLTFAEKLIDSKETVLVDICRSI